MLENGSDLHVNEHQKIRHDRTRFTEERRKKAKSRFFTSHCVYVNCAIKELLYVHSFNWKSAVEHDVVFKMHDIVPSVRYSSVCNVLHLWRISFIPTYT